MKITPEMVEEAINNTGITPIYGMFLVPVNEVVCGCPLTCIYYANEGILPEMSLDAELGDRLNDAAATVKQYAQQHFDASKQYVEGFLHGVDQIPLLPEEEPDEEFMEGYCDGTAVRERLRSKGLLGKEISDKAAIIWGEIYYEERLKEYAT